MKSTTRLAKAIKAGLILLLRSLVKTSLIAISAEKISFSSAATTTAEVDMTGVCDGEGDILIRKSDDRCISVDSVALCSSWLVDVPTRREGLN